MVNDDNFSCMYNVFAINNYIGYFLLMISDVSYYLVNKGFYVFSRDVEYRHQQAQSHYSDFVFLLFCFVFVFVFLEWLRMMSIFGIRT